MAGGTSGCSRPTGTLTRLQSSGIAPSTVPRRRRSHFERRLQIYLARQFNRLVDPLDALLLGIENGEDRSAETLALLEAMGLQSGITDLALLIAGPRVHWIEVKLAKTEAHARTELFDDQIAMHKLLGWYGFPVSVIRSADEFWAVVDGEGVPHRPRPPRYEQLQLPRPRRARLKVRTVA
jgi:hypothetical protein